MTQRKICINYRHALGDAVLLTALCRDLRRSYPGFEIAAETYMPEVFQNSTRVVKSAQDFEHLVLNIRGQALAAGPDNPIHILRSLYVDFTRQTGVAIEPLEAKPELFLTGEEKRPFFDGKYWVVVAGCKYDATVKQYPPSYWQKIVDELALARILCVQAGARERGHYHPKLKNVADLVGRTQNIRDFISLIYGAEGVICGPTAAIHIAAALDKPAVVIGGGREPTCWEWYAPENLAAFGPACRPPIMAQKYFHALGEQDCLKANGCCWKALVVPLKTRDVYGKKTLCLYPEKDGEYDVARCMLKISPEQVVSAVLSYYKSGVLESTGRMAVQVVKEFKSPYVPEGFEKPEIKIPTIMAQGADLWDHPILKGVLLAVGSCRDDRLDEAMRWHETLIAAAPPGRLDVRVILHQPSDRLKTYFSRLDPKAVLVFEEPTTDREALRKLLWTVQTEASYMAYFSDEAYIVGGDWFKKLATKILEKQPYFRLFGRKRRLTVTKEELTLLRRRLWWKNAPLLLPGKNAAAPNGSQIESMDAGFWTGEIDQIKSILLQTEVDYALETVLAEGLRQAGWHSDDWDLERKLIFSPKKEQSNG